MISPSSARAECGGREGGGIELDHFSYSQVQIIYCNESAIFLSTLKYQAHRCPAADLKYKNLWLDDITGTRDNLRETC